MFQHHGAIFREAFDTKECRSNNRPVIESPSQKCPEHRTLELQNTQIYKRNYNVATLKGLKVLKISNFRCCNYSKLQAPCLQTLALIVFKDLVRAERILFLVWSGKLTN